MAIAAIPTKYKHVQFRSRLEARWAAFFDLAGWEWHYEPIDLNGWIPDFVLMGKNGNKIFVEVKPILWSHNGDAFAKSWDASPLYSDDLRKVWNAEIFDPDMRLVIGANLIQTKYEYQATIDGSWRYWCPSAGVGAFINNSVDDDPISRIYMALPIYGDFEYYLDITKPVTPFRHYVSGRVSPSFPLFCDAYRLNALWAEAGNTVQWRPRK
jgi:hypothetical protein